MSLLKKITQCHVPLTKLSGVFTKIISHKKTKKNIIKKIIWFLIYKCIRNTIELKTLKIKWFFQRGLKRVLLIK